MRVIHVGNIANNAFCAAYMDRKKNIDSYVVNPHLSDSIATPLWEFPSSNEILNDLMREIQGWYCAGNWTEILNAWDGNRFSSSKITPGVITYLRKFTTAGKMFAKRLIPRHQRSYISNEIIYRLRNFTQPNLKQFFGDFDVVILYGPYTVLKKFVSPHSLCVTFEHGTIEHFCNGSHKYSKDALAGFKNSTDIIITNQGAIEAIKSHGLNNINLHMSPHPSLDIGIEFFRNQRLLMIKNSEKMNYILAPSRHIMASKIDPGKGNIEIFKAFERLLRVNPDLKLFCIEHGDDLAHSKRVIRNFGIEKSVVWLPLQTRFNLKRLISESICVVDQLNSSSYGTITSDALLLGVPVLTSHNCELDIEFFGECAPVFGCEGENDIFRVVQHLLRLKTNPIVDFHVSTTWGDYYLSPEKAFEVRKLIYSRKSNESNF